VLIKFSHVEDDPSLLRELGMQKQFLRAIERPNGISRFEMKTLPAVHFAPSSYWTL